MSGGSRPTWTSARGVAKEFTFQTSKMDEKSHSKLKFRQSKDLGESLKSAVDVPNDQSKGDPEYEPDDFHDKSLCFKSTDSKDKKEDSLDDKEKNALEDEEEYSLDDKEQNALEDEELNALEEEEYSVEDKEENSLEDEEENALDEEEENASDEEEELMLELARIRAEREEKAEEEARFKQSEALSRNPLLKSQPVLKRRWDDDAVFRHSESFSEEPKGKRFINDSLRSDFHRRFMKRYIQ